jgi:hypothetical protein
MHIDTHVPRLSYQSCARASLTPALGRAARDDGNFSNDFDALPRMIHRVVALSTSGKIAQELWLRAYPATRQNATKVVGVDTTDDAGIALQQCAEPYAVNARDSPFCRRSRRNVPVDLLRTRWRRTHNTDKSCEGYSGSHRSIELRVCPACIYDLIDSSFEFGCVSSTCLGRFSPDIER